jgi:hypothetical protein
MKDTVCVYVCVCVCVTRKLDWTGLRVELITGYCEFWIGLRDCSLFNDIVFSNSVYTASNKMVISEWWIEKDVEGSGSDVI